MIMDKIALIITIIGALIRIENLEDQIDLKTLVIHDGDNDYHVDFDAE